MKAEGYIKEKLDQLNLTLSSDLISLELDNVGLQASSELTKKDGIKLDRFFYNVLPFFLNRASRVSEGQFSIDYSSEALLAYYRYLANKLGLPDEFSNSSIREISPW